MFSAWKLLIVETASDHDKSSNPFNFIRKLYACATYDKTALTQLVSLLDHSFLCAWGSQSPIVTCLMVVVRARVPTLLVLRVQASEAATRVSPRRRRDQSPLACWHDQDGHILAGACHGSDNPQSQNRLALKEPAVFASVNPGLSIDALMSYSGVCIVVMLTMAMSHPFLSTHLSTMRPTTSSSVHNSILISP